MHPELPGNRVNHRECDFKPGLGKRNEPYIYRNHKKKYSPFNVSNFNFYPNKVFKN